MQTYRFKIGETVFVGIARHLNFPGGAYVVTAKLPERDGELQQKDEAGGLYGTIIAPASGRCAVAENESARTAARAIRSSIR